MAAPPSVSDAAPADAAELAAVAAATFPLACPPLTPPEDVAAFLGEHLSPQRFADYLSDPDRRVLVARANGRIIGYAMLAAGIGTDPAVAAAVPDRPAVELSKMYVLSGHHGGVASAALMDAALDRAVQGGASCVWLGVNAGNERAQRFYRKNGFAVTGERRFVVGSRVEHDAVMVRRLRPG